MLANWITLARFPILVVCTAILYRGTPALRLAGVALLCLGLMLDTVDGIVARRTGGTSLLGSVLDIAADRAWELVLWVAFADLGLIPAMIPLVVITRTALTDAFRAIGVSQGVAPFAQARPGLGRFLVASTWMRSGYSIAKVTTFCGLALAQAAGDAPGLREAVPNMLATLRGLAWACVALCVLRGLPVIVGSLRRYWGDSRPPTPLGSPAEGPYGRKAG
jgi:phosphatidylglycerophosphate synthase